MYVTCLFVNDVSIVWCDGKRDASIASFEESSKGVASHLEVKGDMRCSWVGCVDIADSCFSFENVFHIRLLCAAKNPYDACLIKFKMCCIVIYGYLSSVSSIVVSTCIMLSTS